MSTNGAASCKFDQLSVEELQEILISNEQKLQALAEEIRTKNEQIDSYKIEVEWLKIQLVKGTSKIWPKKNKFLLFEKFFDDCSRNS